MDDGACPVIGLLVFVLWIILHIVTVGFKAAMDNISDIVVDKKVEEGDRKARVMVKFLDEPTNFGLFHSLMTTVNMTAFVMAETLLFREKLWTIVIMAAVWILVDVFTVHKIAARRPESWGFSLASVVKALYIFFSPIYLIMDKGSDIIIRILGLDPDINVDDVTEDEIISIVNDGHEQGVLEESEAEMIQNIVEFGDKEAKDIMTHRKEIVAIDSQMTFEETLRFMQEKINSRFPVYTDNIDNIIGVIHIKDVLFHSQKKELFHTSIAQIDGLIREIDMIPETRNINTLFQEMQSNKNHMVIVVDEYGQTSGLVAMEDILEEIVGNILDEYDVEESFVTKQSDGSYIMKGLTSLEEVEETLEIKFETEDYETLNGFLISKIDKIPDDDDTFTVEEAGWKFEILQVENKTIKSVKVYVA